MGADTMLVSLPPDSERIEIKNALKWKSI